MRKLALAVSAIVLFGFTSNAVAQTAYTAEQAIQPQFGGPVSVELTTSSDTGFQTAPATASVQATYDFRPNLQPDECALIQGARRAGKDRYEGCMVPATYQAAMPAPQAQASSKPSGTDQQIAIFWVQAWKNHLIPTYLITKGRVVSGQGEFNRLAKDWQGTLEFDREFQDTVAFCGTYQPNWQQPQTAWQRAGASVNANASTSGRLPLIPNGRFNVSGQVGNVLEFILPSNQERPVDLSQVCYTVKEEHRKLYRSGSW